MTVLLLASRILCEICAYEMGDPALDRRLDDVFHLEILERSRPVK